MSGHCKFCLIVVTLSLPIFVASARSVPPKPINAIIADALDKWHAPGLAVAIVQQGRVIYLRGHGVRALGQAEPITPDTVFPMASCTKPFTSLAVAMMVGDGRMAWDEPVRTHVPFFHLADPVADRSATIRDLLCHRTGVGSHDMLWYKAPWGMAERIRKIGKVELESPFRSLFHYQTILYGTAGYAAGRANGGDWRDLVQKRVLDPLGMAASCPVFPKDAADLAMPHRKDAQGKIAPIARYPLDRADPAGSLHSTARDLSRFLRFQLGDGTWEGKRLVRADLLAETHQAQMVIRREGFAEVMNPETVQISYALGWILQDYRGKRLLLHGGAIDGFRSHLALLPDAKIGIALLSNLDGGYMNLAISNSLTDLLLDLPQRDWNAYYLAIQAHEDRAAKERPKVLRASRKPGTKPSLPLAAYAGDYHDAAYGTCHVRLEKGLLIWKWAAWRCDLEHFQDDTFLANGEGLTDGEAKFGVSDGKVKLLKILGRTFKRGEPGA